MKQLIYVFTVLAAFVNCSGNKAAQEDKVTATSPTEVKDDDAVVVKPQYEADTLKGSLKAKASGLVGKAEVKINYHSPAVRGRIIWGGLVPYDNVWVTGAHMATSFETSADLQIAGSVVPAGKYALFTIPGEEKWIVIINKKWQQHLTDEYDSKDDIVRLEVVPTSTERSQERLSYTVQPVSENEGVISVHWEKVLIDLPISVL